MAISQNAVKEIIRDEPIYVKLRQLVNISEGAKNKKGGVMNREQVETALVPVAGMKVRDVEHGTHGRVMFEGERMTLRPGRGSTYEVADPYKDDLLNFAGVNGQLAKTITPATLGRVMTECMARKEKYGLILQDDHVVGITPYRERHPVDTERVLNTIERTIPSADFQRVLVLPQHIVSLETVGVEERPVQRGDLVKAGTRVVFSPIGTTLPVVQSYVLRLACTNGAVTNDIVHNFGYGEGDNLWQWFRQSILKAVRSIDLIIQRWQNLLREEISPADRAVVIATLIRQAGLRGEEAAAVQAQALELPPANAYEAMNLITWASSHIVRDPARVVRAQRVAAEYDAATTHRRICPVCRRER